MRERESALQEKRYEREHCIMDLTFLWSNAGLISLQFYAMLRFDIFYFQLRFLNEKYKYELGKQRDEDCHTSKSENCFVSAKDSKLRPWRLIKESK